MTSDDGARGRRRRRGRRRASTSAGGGARGFEEGARATGANIDWARALFFFAGLGIGSCAFGARGARGRAKTRARDEGGRRGGEPL